MRYYEVYLPGEDGEPAIVGNVRRLRHLPDGARVVAIITERDGSLADSWEVPVVNGRVQVTRRGKDAPRYQGL